MEWLIKLAPVLGPVLGTVVVVWFFLQFLRGALNSQQQSQREISDSCHAQQAESTKAIERNTAAFIEAKEEHREVVVVLREFRSLVKDMNGRMRA